jgi:uncharacterized damage-inducible protein DinB
MSGIRLKQSIILSRRECRARRFAARETLSNNMQPEPWLRGPITDVNPLLAPVLYSFRQASEDLAKHTEGFSAAQIWARPCGAGSVGFHLRHIAGSTDRLMTYLRAEALSPQQMAALESEQEPGASREALLAQLERVFEVAGRQVRAIDPATLAQPRHVGRQRLPATVIGLLTHIAEHTARHVGQAISAARLARLQTEPGPEGAP